MARQNPISETEKAIGQRLRKFRIETMGMTGAEFARRIGIDSNRLATYEHGRARLPYHVFRSITEQHFLSPFWLALGDQATPMRFNSPFDDSGFVGNVPPRGLFSAAYDKFISAMFKQFPEQRQKLGIQELEQIRQKSLRLVAILITKPGQLNEEALSLLEELRSFKESKKGLQAMLDTPMRIRDNADVKAKKSKIESLEDLMDAVRIRLKQHGQKAALAKHCEVSRQAVDQWLSGDTKPSADLTFKLLNWVSQ